MDLLFEKRRALREGAEGRLVLEVAAVELARLPSARDLDALIEALRSGGGGAPDAILPGRRAAVPAPAPPSPSRAVVSPPPPPARSSSAGPPSSAAAPEPVVREAVGCAAGAKTVALEAVVAAWPEVVRVAGEKMRRLRSLLDRAAPVGVEGETLRLAVADATAMDRTTLKDPAALDALRAGTAAAVGVPLRATILEGAVPPARPAGPVAAATERAPRAEGRAQGVDDLRSDPALRAVLDTFGARVLSIDRRPAPSAPVAERGAAGAAPDDASAGARAEPEGA
jgi:hypothetical protein